MKTERRHELQKNELADQLGSWIQQASPYGKQILGVVAGLLLLFLLVRWFSGSQTQQLEKAWLAYHQAINDRELVAGGQRLKPTRLNQVMETYAGTLPAAWARLRLAEDKLDAGTYLLFTNRAEGQEELQDAQSMFEKVEADAKQFNEPARGMLLKRASLGKAKAAECLSSGDLKDALQDYKNIEDKWPVSSYSMVAKSRQEVLAKESASEFYTWFDEYKPARPVLPPSDGTPGVKPDFMEDLLKRPIDSTKKPNAEGDAPATTPPATIPPAKTPSSTETQPE